VFDGRLRRHKYGPHVYSDGAVEVRKLQIVNQPESQHARAVDQDVKAAQFLHRALDGGDDGAGIGAVGLDGNCLDSERLRRFGRLVRLVGRTAIGECDMRAFAGQTLDDGRTDSAAAAGDERVYSLVWSFHAGTTQD
jgi:hypothetical protein